MTALRPHCRRCREPLAAFYTYADVTTEAPRPTLPGFEAADPAEKSTKRVRGPLLGYGYRASGFFCSLNCGHGWAVDRLKAAEAKSDPSAGDRDVER